MTDDQQLEYSPIDSAKIRDNNWLQERLTALWGRHFADVTQPNQVLVRFGRKSRTRLGSIGMEGWSGRKPGRAYTSRLKVEEGTSVITLTGHFMDPRVPDFVVDATIGHEMVHYAHGFHSPHPQLYEHPHQGNIVDKEMIKRGMGDILSKQKRWLKLEWRSIIGQPATRRKPRKRRSYAAGLRLLRSYFQ